MILTDGLSLEETCVVSDSIMNGVITGMMFAVVIMAIYVLIMMIYPMIESYNNEQKLKQRVQQEIRDERLRHMANMREDSVTDMILEYNLDRMERRMGGSESRIMGVRSRELAARRRALRAYSVDHQMEIVRERREAERRETEELDVGVARMEPEIIDKIPVEEKAGDPVEKKSRWESLEV